MRAGAPQLSALSPSPFLELFSAARFLPMVLVCGNGAWARCGGAHDRFRPGTTPARFSSSQRDVGAWARERESLQPTVPGGTHLLPRRRRSNHRPKGRPPH